MPRLQAQTTLKGILKDYFTNSLKTPLAWCTSAGPAEILRALGFDIYFPENHGAMLGASRLAMDYMPRAHQAGYDSEICSYLTADIGAHLAGKTPLTAAYGLETIPKPDLIVYNTNQCREVAEWFNYFGREFDCPTFGVYPPRYLEQVNSSDIDNVVTQFDRLIKLGEEIIGHPLDQGKLSETLRLSKEGTQLWKEVLDTATHRPSPLTFFDGCILMAPIVILRGTKICVEFYQDTLAELKSLVNNNGTTIVEEQIRLFWEGMPIWGKLRSMAEFFAQNNAVVVASTYCNSWVFDDFDENNPLESMAAAYTKIFINRGENAKLSMLSEMMLRFECDGVIYHDSKTCFNNSNNRFGLPERVTKQTGIPSVTIDGDLCDLRFFSDGQSRTKLETFIEQLRSKK